MKKTAFYIFLIALFPLFWNGKIVGKVNTMTVSLIDTNLIFNPLFQYDYSAVVDSGNQQKIVSTGYIPSDTDWHLSYQPNYPIFVQDAPSGGGSWSLGLVPSEEQYIQTADYYITGISGANTYTLSSWWKVLSRNSFVNTNGSVTVGIYSNHQISQSQSLYIQNQDTVWTNDTLRFSLTTQTTDSVVVRLSGGIAVPSSHSTPDGLFIFEKVQLIKH